MNRLANFFNAILHYGTFGLIKRRKRPVVSSRSHTALPVSNVTALPDSPEPIPKRHAHHI